MSEDQIAWPPTGISGESVTGRNASLSFSADLQDHCDTLSPVEEKERLHNLDEICFGRKSSLQIAAPKTTYRHVYQVSI
jgi:hypothetical protein